MRACVRTRVISAGSKIEFIGTWSAEQDVYADRREKSRRTLPAVNRAPLSAEFVSYL